jgi:hypothetical protein
MLLGACAGADDGVDAADAAGADGADGANGADGADGASDTPAAEADSADDDAPPRFTKALYLDLADIERISRFRSGVGHDFSDAFESCRSMKHYVCMTGCSGGPVDWLSIALRSPVDGTIVALESEQTFGTQVRIAVQGHEGWIVRIFHVTPELGLAVGSSVVAGQLLGHHASNDTMSDIAVEHFGGGGARRVSWFDTMDDALLAAFAARGATRDQLVISKEARDADPLGCEGERFTSEGVLENWVDLTPN